MDAVRYGGEHVARMYTRWICAAVADEISDSRGLQVRGWTRAKGETARDGRRGGEGRGKEEGKEACEVEGIPRVCYPT